MNDLTLSAKTLALTDDELIQVLQASLYPGAKSESIKMVLGYCRAAGLDPMQKPVHLVPMNVKKPGGGREDCEWRDVVMPGIGLYRVQAARTGELAGIDEPQFGPMQAKFGIEFPDWCKVTVYRMISGQRVPFTACEFWVENYATKRRDSDAPNAMWERRPRGQIAKCAEAQALRKAFPELGSMPTADETIVDVVDIVNRTNTSKPTVEIVEQSNPWTDELKRDALSAAAQGMTAYTKWWKKQGDEFRLAAVNTQEHAEYKSLASLAPPPVTPAVPPIE